jgi:16S rRNA (guanine527-N7)-methyltransferase
VKHPPEQSPTEDPSTLVQSATELGIDLEGIQVEALLSFELLLIDRAIPLGLVARGDRTTLRERHILDSLRGVLALEPSDTDALDLGSGAGLPGIVVAIARPSLRVGLVEVRRRRVAFLELAVERLGLSNVAVLPLPAGRLDRVVDVCFARALAGLSKTWEIARHLLRPEGRLVYFGGEGFREPDQMPPAASSLRLLRTPALASSGPVVIMTRQ